MALLFRHAARQGSVQAMRALGALYVRGEGVPRNTAERMGWFDEAAMRDDADAMFALSQGFERGRGAAPGAAILPGDQVAAMLRQCSREAPEAGETSWQPEEADIAALEAALAAALREHPETRGKSSPSFDWSRAPEGWNRQYVGIVRGRRRFVYGNFYPRRLYGEEAMPNWTRPVLICDGGSVFFGVEYDVEARRFTHIAFNGAI